MNLFLASFLAIYTGMHALVFWGMYPLLFGHRALPTLTGVWMALMVLAPVAVRVLDKAGHNPVARALAWVGYSCMGFVFLAFSLFTILGLWDLAALGLDRLGAPNLTLHGPVSALVVLLLALGVGLYGLYEAQNLRVERVLLQTTKLPAGVARLRIAQVSDIHLGLLHREETLAPIISHLQELQPDLVVATGDIVDAQIDHLDGMSELWQRLQPPLGKFAVTGNHEFYAGLGQALQFMERSGFTVLRGEGVTVAGTLTLVGIDDPTGDSQNEAGLLTRHQSALFTLLLKHRPRVNEAAAGLFDLQLSGHAHRGQIFPFNYVTGLEYPQQEGLYSLPGGGRLYVSRGTGTWGPPMRVLSPPEITLFEIVREQPQP
ncbi:metallophosphoesterase [Geoalkalibacter halelectricus]|uniref:Metallophosphoesterase n=1 Tax=Geoalkalibacter halelectricus TaxID=2847045 RepID=A0ABY5ZKI9_9BACT|nr:metallophosphoesterase [Geoalkalibacter halelectricus]MDO3376654.1 metallophosphoesterase [Geoalkalibacter halelectricus]UWZ79648.1 metallophosphoesterase [Geoalkalibacter halelectricus]